jgi:hypothetical protein
MDYPLEKRADMHYDTKELGYTSSLPPTYSKIDVTKPQTYDLKSTKTDWIYKGAYALLATGTNTEVWNVQIHTSKLEIFRADGTLVGTAGLHHWKTKVDVSMKDTRSSDDSEFTMKRNKGIFTEKKTFEIQGQKLTWKRAGKMTSKFELVDEAGDVVARIGATSWKGRYKLEIVKAGMGVELVEACVVTALATAENEKRMIWGASNGAASNAGASAAVSG